MGKAKELDRAYFEAHPTAFSYERAPLPQEWADTDIPADAMVSVYKINNTSRVRALQNKLGERVAPAVLDVDAVAPKPKTSASSRSKSAAA